MSLRHQLIYLNYSVLLPKKRLLTSKIQRTSFVVATKTRAQICKRNFCCFFSSEIMYYGIKFISWLFTLRKTIVIKNNYVIMVFDKLIDSLINRRYLFVIYLNGRQIVFTHCLTFYSFL